MWGRRRTTTRTDDVLCEGRINGQFSLLFRRRKSQGIISVWCFSISCPPTCVCIGHLEWIYYDTLRTSAREICSPVHATGRVVCANPSLADYYVKQWPEKENNEMLWIIALLIFGNMCSLITGMYPLPRAVLPFACIITQSQPITIELEAFTITNPCYCYKLFRIGWGRAYSHIYSPSQFANKSKKSIQDSE